ncbi:beta strand repeat-containing protein, partial [Pseudomonas sp. CGJS7]|uniref:beta strand repeat-containing protein n=1 Tax=Pseudomonas sp. CGJS7 TaxID=3109348 RepID=UPI00300B1D9D
MNNVITRTPASQSSARGDASTGSRIARTGVRVLLSTVLALAALPAMAQFANPLRNTATIRPPTDVTNVDTACSANGGTFNNANGECSATDSNTLAAVANLTLTKTDGVTSVDALGSTIYTIVLTNNGPSAANGTVVTDPAATGLTKTSVSCSVTGGSAVCPAVTVANFESGVTVATLPSGGQLTFTVNANVTATSGSVTNAVTATLPPNTTDPSPTGTVVDTNTVNPRADLVLTKTNGTNNVTAGGTTAYTIVLRNNGPSVANGTVVADPAATGLTKTSVSCTVTAGTAACPAVTVANFESGVTVANLPSGGELTFTVNANVTATSGSVTNTVTATLPAGTTDPTPTGPVSDTDTVDPRADLVLTKTNGTNNVTAGGTTAYTIVLRNNGPSVANGTVVADPAATGLTKTSVSCTVTAGTAACPAVTVANFESGVTVANLPSGGELTFTVNANVTATSGSVTNTVTATLPPGTTDPTPTGPITDTDTVDPRADLVLTKTNGTNNVTAGGTTAYTIVLRNNGPSVANGTVVTDPAATGLAKTSVSCTVSAGSAVCPAVTVANFESGVTVATLPSGGELTFTVNANVTATSGSVTNTVTATLPPGTTDPTPTGPITDTDTVDPRADLTLTKTNGTNNVTAGGATAYTIVLTNNGPSAADGTVVTDPAATGLTKTSVSCTVTGGSAVCPAVTVANFESGVTVASLPSGGQLTFTVNANVTATSGSVTNTVTATLPPGTTDPTPVGPITDTDTVDPRADLVLTKTNGTNNVTAGGTTAYTIVLRNNGPSVADGTVVTDPAATGLTKTSVSCSVTAGSAVCPAVTVANFESGVTVANLPSGGELTFTVNANVTATSGSVTNTVTATLPPGTTDPTPTGPITDTDTVDPRADLVLTKTNGTNNVTAGGTTAYTIVLRNNGPSVADGTVVTDPAATGLTKTSVSCTVTAGSAVCPAVTVANFESGVTVANLPSGGELTFTVNANVTATSGSVANTVTATLPPGTTDPTPTGPITDTDTVDPRADLTLTKTNGTAAVDAGGTTTYTIVLTNNGPSAADGTVVTDPAATGLAKTSVSCSVTGGSAVCPAVTVANFESGVTVASLPSGGQLTFTVIANVTATSGSVANTVTATLPPGTTDPTPVGPITDTDTVTERADLSVTKTVNPTNPLIGSVVTFTITVSNATGPSAAADVVVNDPLPNGYTFVSASSGNYNSGSGAWTVGTLAVGASQTLTIDARVLETGTYVNTATVTASTLDPTPGNNSSTATPTPVAAPKLGLRKDPPINADNDGSGTVTLGDVLTYTVTATNTGNVTLNNVVISDPQLTPNSQTCATLAVGAECELTGTHQVTLTDVNNNEIVNTAQVTSTEVTTPVTASVTTPVLSRPINAQGDSGGVTSGAAGGTAVPNVLVNDTLNGQPATVGTVTISSVSSTHPNVTIDPATGAVNVAPGTPEGNYTLRYRICEIADPTNCSEADVAVQVGKAAINAVPDPGADIVGATGGVTVPNVLANDLLDGAPVNAADVNLTTVSSTHPGVTLDTATGAVSVAPGTPAGDYVLTYRICEKINPTSNCSETTVTVKVTAALIVANTDPGADIVGATGGVTVPNVLANDTLNGSPVNAADINLSFVSATHPGVTLDTATGAVSVAPGTPAGDYVLTYRICEKLNPTSNCSETTVTVKVTAALIVANTDPGADIVGASGGVTVPNVLANDTLNGLPVNAADVNLTTVSSTHPGVTLDAATGAVSVAPGTPAGDYVLTYQICEKLNPTSNCSSTTVTVKVTAALIVANTDPGADIVGASGGVTVPNVLANDTLNGQPVNAADVNLTTVSSTHPGVTLDAATGAVSVAPGTPAGDYVLTYQICEKLNPTSNCSSTTVTVKVTAALIVANTDPGADIVGASGGVTVP